MSYIVRYPHVILALLLQHVQMTVTALLIASLIALPVGLLIARRGRLATVVLGLLGIVYTVPSIALIILFIPFFGLNATSVIVALVLYTQIILVRNIVAGVRSVSPAVIEAAQGMGMNGWQVWWQVELPLALPIILAGVRLAAVVAIAIATVGAMFGAGGLGRLLFDGIAQPGRYDKIWAGAISVGVLALFINRALLVLERRFALEGHLRRSEWRRAALPASQGEV